MQDNRHDPKWNSPRKYKQYSHMNSLCIYDISILLIFFLFAHEMRIMYGNTASLYKQRWAKPLPTLGRVETITVKSLI